METTPDPAPSDPGVVTHTSPEPAEDDFTPMVLVPRLYVDGDQRPVYEMETTNAQAAFDAAVGAERLDLGWTIVAFHSAEVDGVSQREYRVVAWRQLTSDVGPTPEPKP